MARAAVEMVRSNGGIVQSRIWAPLSPPRQLHLPRNWRVVIRLQHVHATLFVPPISFQHNIISDQKATPHIKTPRTTQSVANTCSFVWSSQRLVTKQLLGTGGDSCGAMGLATASILGTMILQTGSHMSASEVNAANGNGSHQASLLGLPDACVLVPNRTWLLGRPTQSIQRV